MKDLIETLQATGFKLTLHDADGDFVLAIKVDDPSELFYIGAWAAENKSYLGACHFSERNKIAYFPLQIVDKEGYELICGK